MKYVHGGDRFEKEIELDFSVNTNPLGIPEAVVRAAYKGVLLAEQYPDYSNRRLCRALAQQYELPHSYFLCANGAAAMLYELVQAIKPSKGMVLAPTFLEYEKALQAVGARVCHHLLEASQGFALDVEVLLADLEQNRPEILFLCNPNNPTGRVIPRKLLCRLLDFCEERKILLVIDECFLGFTQEQSMAAYCKTHQYLFVVNAFTKLYGMPGLRSGYGISGNAHLLEAIRSVRQDWNLNSVAEEASIAALKEKGYVEETKKLIAEQKKYLTQELTVLGIQVYESDANYLLLYTDRELYSKCLEKKILIRDCSNYKNLSKGYCRVAVRRSEENQILIRRLGEIIYG